METHNNTSLKTLDELNHEEMIRHIPLMTFLIILCISGIVGNSLVFHVFTKSYTPSTFRMFVTFLSVVDLFTCTIAIPLELIALIFEYKSDIDLLCKIYPFLLTWPTITSIFLLLAIATDRYRKVCAPFSWQLSYRAARTVCISLASLSIGCSVISSVIFGVRTTKHNAYNVTVFECEVTETMKQTPFPLVNNIIFVFIFVVAITVITILYCCIAIRVKQQMKRKCQFLFKRENCTKAKSIADVYNNVERNKTNRCGLEGETHDCNNTRDTEKDMGKRQEKPVNDENINDTKLATSSEFPTRNLQTKTYRTSLVMFMVTSVFFISYVPSISLLLIRALDKGFVQSLTDFERSVYKFFIRSYLINSVINPLVYGAFDRKFRKSCKMLVFCKKT